MDRDQGGGQACPRASAGRSWLIAALLGVCYTLSYVDRQVLSLLVDPIKRALNLSDTQIGLIQGVSFSLFYVAASLPLAWIADHTRRSRLMSACIAFWSAMTMLCAIAGNFWQLLGARIGVAVGEAGLPPAALATLAGRFDARRLATATSMFMLAPFVGGGLALAGGGALYKAVGRWDRSGLAVLGGLADWQWVFLLVGAPGLIVALLLLLIRDSREQRGRHGGSMAELFLFVRREWKILVLYGLAMATMMTLLSSYVTWLPAAIMRSKGVDEATVGTLFGPIYLVAGAAGTLSAGILITMRGGQDPVRAVVRYMLLTTLLLWPVGTFGPLTSSFGLELALMGVALFLISSVANISSLPIQYVTPPHLRAQALALLGMVSALFGTGLGPVLAGVMSDQLRFAREPLSLSLSIIAAATAPCVMVLLVFVLRQHARVRLDLSARLARERAPPASLTVTGAEVDSPTVVGSRNSVR